MWALVFAKCSKVLFMSPSLGAHWATLTFDLAFR